MLGLAASLIRDGLTVFIDQNRSADEEKIPWPIWMEDRIEGAGYVLLVCPDLYWNKVRQKVPNDVGHGVCWEANLIYNALYTGKLNTTRPRVGHHLILLQLSIKLLAFASLLHPFLLDLQHAFRP